MSPPHVNSNGFGILKPVCYEQALRADVAALNAILDNDDIRVGNGSSLAPLLKELDPSKNIGPFAKMIVFAKSVPQNVLLWRNCSAHKNRLSHLDLSKPEATFHQMRLYLARKRAETVSSNAKLPGMAPKIAEPTSSQPAQKPSKTNRLTQPAGITKKTLETSRREIQVKTIHHAKVIPTTHGAVPKAPVPIANPTPQYTSQITQNTAVPAPSNLQPPSRFIKLKNGTIIPESHLNNLIKNRVTPPQQYKPPVNRTALPKPQPVPPRPKKEPHQTQIQWISPHSRSLQNSSSKATQHQSFADIKAQRIAHNRSLFPDLIARGDDMLAYAFREYMEVHPTKGADRVNRYYTNLLANQTILESDTEERQSVVLYAKEKWWNFWQVGDREEIMEEMVRKGWKGAGWVK